MGDKIQSIDKAVRLVSERCGEVIKYSSKYKSEPWGFKDKVDDFVNIAILIDTVLSPFELLQECISIEKELGRIQKTKSNNYSSRTIDIDIIFYDSLIIDTEILKIPHPLMQDRMFVLKPINEIAPKFIHPIFNKSIQELTNICSDKSKVK